MNGQQLKNSILQMAVQGKLVPQDPNDEPASVLVERIRAEKEKLIKEGKIKKEKNPSYIFRGADNLPYEQVGKNEPVCIVDEVPFDIPDSWEWIRFGNLVQYSMGKTPPRKDERYWNNPIYKWVSIADLIADGHVTDTKESVNDYAAENTFKNRISLAGTLLMSFKLTVGKTSILDIDAYHNEAIISIYPFVDDERIMTNYLFKVMPLLSQLGNTKSAIKGATLNSNSIFNLLIPLPSVKEQQRIVEKLVEVEPSLNDYRISEEQSSNLYKAFPVQLKKSILQWAVQGKLVPQNPNDEPASVLLERIREEKARLVKDGKIKKDKNESVIYRRDNSHYEKRGSVERCIDNEIPFNIPQNWVWCRLSNIFQVLNGDRGKNYPAKTTLSSQGIPFISALNLDGKTVVDDDNLKCLTDEQYNRLGNGKLQKGDVVVCIRGSLGKHGRFPFDKGAIASSLVILRTLAEYATLYEYIMLYLDSPLFFDEIKKYDNGTAQPNLSAKTLSSFLYQSHLC